MTDSCVFGENNTMLTVINNIKEIVDSSDELGIFISGGFDSTVLSAVIFSHLTETNYYGNKITFFTVPRYDDSKIHAHRIMNWLGLKYPKVYFDSKTVGNPDDHHSRQVKGGIIESLNNSNMKIVLADTMIPTPLIGPSAPMRNKSLHPRVAQPFNHYDKRISLQIANHLGLLNDISTITHSCTASKNLRCKKCWQCLEREWAFRELNLIDVGTM